MMSRSLIATGGPNLIGLPGQNFQTYHINHRVAGGGEKAAPFCGRENLTKQLMFGGSVSHSQITSSKPNSINPPSLTSQPYHNQPSGGWALAELAGEWKAGSILWQGKFDKKMIFGGGGLAIAKLHPVGLNGPICLVKIFNHTTINHRVAGLWLNRPGDGKAALFCGREILTKI